MPALPSSAGVCDKRGCARRHGVQVRKTGGRRGLPRKTQWNRPESEGNSSGGLGGSATWSSQNPMVAIIPDCFSIQTQTFSGNCRRSMGKDTGQ